MTEPQAAGATPADQGATPDPTATTPDPAAMADDGAQLGEAGLAALKRERELREAAEKREKKIAGELKSYQDRDKTDGEKATERIAELERTNAELAQARREDTLRLAASAAARKLGFRNPDLAYRLVAGSVEFDDKGQPKGVDKALEDIAKADPYLVAGTTDYGGGPRGGSAGGGADMNDVIRRAAGRN